MGTGEEVTGIVNRLYKPVLHSASEERGVQFSLRLQYST